MSFLDVQVFLKEGQLDTDLYTKPTDTHQYLYQRSCHPSHYKGSITFSLALHLRCICSRPPDYAKRTGELEQYLVHGGHNGVHVQRQIEKATMVMRSDALKPCDKSTIECVPLVITYHPQLPKLQEILSRHLPTLLVSETMREAVPLPPLVAYRSLKNLRDLLARVTLKPSLQV